MLLRPTESGIWCEAGGFHLDPWRPVDRAVISHAHSDHARAGCRAYLCAARGEGVLRERIGLDAPIETLAWGERREIGGVAVSLHPAGHVLGAAQIRVEHRGEVWVFSGDYKRAPDPTADEFEPVACHTFITESTFGLPIYRWQEPEEIFAAMNTWWRGNAGEGRTSVISAYALGKAQRVLAGVDASIGPIAVHGAVARFLPRYAAAGVVLPEVVGGDADGAKRVRGVGLVIAPESAIGSPWIRKFGEVSTAAASGWMKVRAARRRAALDRGFALSDHADWPALLRTIAETGAQRVLATHGYTAPLTRYLRERGIDAGVLPTRYEGERGEAEADEAAPTAEEAGA